MCNRARAALSALSLLPGRDRVHEWSDAKPPPWTPAWRQISPATSCATACS